MNYKEEIKRRGTTSFTTIKGKKNKHNNKGEIKRKGVPYRKKN